MPIAQFFSKSDWRRPSLRHRAIAFVLALVVEILFLLALLGIVGPAAKQPEPPVETVTFELPAPKPAPEKAAQAKDSAPEKRAATRPLPQPKTPEKQPLPTPPIPTPNMVVVSKDAFAALDISKLPKGASGSGGNSRSVYGPGEGPGGKQLYPAEWYREPNHGELAAYLPNGAPPGSWAMIACRTVAKYHVENCVGLGESRPGLSAALRQAAWQFLVLPPRIDGKPQIGAWVRIRFDFNERGEN